jgi:hypothetical protein
VDRQPFQAAHPPRHGRWRSRTTRLGPPALERTRQAYYGAHPPGGVIKPAYRGAALLELHWLLVLPIADKHAWDRGRLPRAWANATAAFRFAARYGHSATARRTA